MKVKELIEMLKSFDPNATVCVEANNDCLAQVVKQYSTVDGTQVYIADNTDYLDTVINVKEEG